MLARAFRDDPLQRYTFPDPEERARLSPAHFEAIVRYGLLAGEVWVTEGEIEAAGVWWTPERSEIDEAALQEAGFYRLPEVIGAGAFNRFMGVIDCLEPLHKREMREPHWYAMVLGVDVGKQGQGLGSALLAPVLSRADATGTPCYLETTQPRNVAFYKLHGFEVLVEGREPVSGLDYWTFRRAPR